MATRGDLDVEPVVKPGVSAVAARNLAAPAARNSSASLRRALRLLLFVGSADSPSSGVGSAELARALDMNIATVGRLIAPLCDARLIEREPVSGRFRLGPRTAELGQAYLDRLDIRSAAHSVLADVAKRSGETTYLVIPDAPDVVYIDKVDSVQSVRLVAQIGSRQPMHSTAVGKAILAAGQAELVDLVVESAMPARTERTHTTRATLEADLATIRLRGYAIDDIENEPGVRCVAAAICDSVKKTVAAISISGPASRITTSRTSKLGELIRDAAHAVSARLGASPR